MRCHDDYSPSRDGPILMSGATSLIIWRAKGVWKWPPGKIRAMR
jgi:hypothetical protein